MESPSWSFLLRYLVESLVVDIDEFRDGRLRWLGRHFLIVGNGHRHADMHP